MHETNKDKDCQDELDVITDKYNLSPEERDLLEKYMKLTPEQKAATLQFMSDTATSFNDKKGGLG